MYHSSNLQQYAWCARVCDGQNTKRRIIVMTVNKSKKLINIIYGGNCLDNHVICDRPLSFLKIYVRSSYFWPSNELGSLRKKKGGLSLWAMFR